MLKQISLEDALEIVLYQCEEVKMITLTDGKWSNAKIGTLNEVADRLREAVFLYDEEDPERELLEIIPPKQDAEKSAPDVEWTSAAKPDAPAEAEVQSGESAMEPSEDTEAPKKRRGKITDEEVGQMAALRIGGWTIADIAKKFDTTYQSVSNHLKNYEKKHPGKVTSYYKRP